MLNKIIGAISLLLSGAWWLGIGREFIKAVIFDRILHMLNPNASAVAALAFQYGPPVVLAILGLYLLARAPTSPVTSQPAGDRVQATTRWQGDKLIPLGQYIIIASIVLATVGLVVGMVLIFVGDQQNARKRLEAINNPPKAPSVATTPPPVASAPTSPPPPAPAIAEVPIAPPPAPAAPPPAPPRKFVDAHVTPEYLLGLYEGNTTLRAETLVSEQIDKWMTLSGPLGEVHAGRPIFDGAVSPTLVSFAYRPGNKTVIYMWFSGEWIARLALLSRNQNISVVGQLKKVTSYNSTVQFENCELVESTPETPAPTAPAPNPNPSTRPRRRRSAKGKQPRS